MKFSGSTPHQIIYSTYGDVVDVQDNEVSPSKILQATVMCLRFRELIGRNGTGTGFGVAKDVDTW